MLTLLKKSLLPLQEGASLLGLEFACKSKELVDQVKAIRSTIQKDNKVLSFDGAISRVGNNSQRPGRDGD